MCVTVGPSKIKVLEALKKVEDEQALSLAGERSNPTWQEAQQSGALFLSNAMELEDLQ